MPPASANLSLTYALLILAGLVGRSLAIGLRDALSAQVPPARLTLPAPLRPALATLAGLLVTFFTGLAAGQAWQAALIATAATALVTTPTILRTEKTSTAGSAPPSPPSPPPAA